MARKNTQWGKFSSVSMFLYLNMSSTFLSTSDRQKTIFLLCQYILIPQIKSMVKANNTSPFFSQNMHFFELFGFTHV